MENKKDDMDKVVFAFGIFAFSFIIAYVLFLIERIITMIF